MAEKRYQVVVNGTRTEENYFPSKARAQAKANELIKKGKGGFWVKIEDTLANNRVVGESKDGKPIKF